MAQSLPCRLDKTTDLRGQHFILWLQPAMSTLSIRHVVGVRQHDEAFTATASFSPVRSERAVSIPLPLHCLVPGQQS